MTTPIDPGDTGALADVVISVVLRDKPDKATLNGNLYGHIAAAVARAVCPPDYVVVRRDDLETALYGSQYWGEELRQDGEQEALDRLRALIGDGHA